MTRQQPPIVLDAVLALDGREAQVAQLAHEGAHQTHEDAAADVQGLQGTEVKDDPEDHHAQHTADKAAHGALHSLVGAYQRRQLVLAAGHAGEQGRRVTAEGRHQRHQHQSAAVGQQPQQQQAAEGGRDGQPRQRHDAHIQQGQGVGLAVGQHARRRQRYHAHQQQPVHDAQRQLPPMARTVKMQHH